MTAEGPRVEKIVEEDTTLNKFMMRIYKTTGLSIFASLGTSYWIASMSPFVVFHPFMMLFGGLFMSLGGISYFRSISPTIIQVEENGKQIVKWINPLSRQLVFSAIIIGSGLSLTPLLAVLNDPSMILLAMGLSITMMGGSSLYALKKPLGEFKAWEATLAGGLFGILGMNLLSILLFSVMGPNFFSYTCSKLDLYLGIMLFSSFQAYDTHFAVEEFRRGQYDHLSIVIKFFLNFSNLFVRVLQVLSRYRDSNQ